MIIQEHLRRLRAIERRLDILDNNAAPTVPIYGLSAPAITPPPSVAKIMVAAASKAYHSDDGVTWEIAAESSDGFNAVTYSPNVGWILGLGRDGVAVNTIWTSTSGTQWTPQTTPWDNLVGVNSLAYSPALDLIVAITIDGSDTANGAGIMSSTDGITWTEHDSYWNGQNMISDVAWVSFLNQFVLVANGVYSTDPNSSFPHCLGTSDDGMNWVDIATRVDPTDMSHARAVMLGIGAGNAGELILCGNFRDGGISEQIYNVLTSTDGGASFDIHATSGSGANAYSCAAKGARIVIGTNDSPDNDIVKTDDGFDTIQVVDATLDFVNNIIWSPNANMLIAVGNDFSGNPFILTSPDGLTWTLPVPSLLDFGMDVWDIDAIL